MINEKRILQTVLQSWERCMDQKLPREQETPLHVLTKEEWQKKIKENDDLIHKFNSFIDKYMDIVKNIKRNYCIVLFDKYGYILSIRQRPNTLNKKNCSFLSKGVSFEEFSIGTNALTLAKVFNSPVYLPPEFHYCCRLKDWYEYCIPLGFNGEGKGYISIISMQYPIFKALKGFLHIMEIELCNQYLRNDMLNVELIERLTQKQFTILKLLAEGLSDENIASTLNISLATVKYHNQNIFKALNATNRVEAVVKALLVNEISISDLYHVVT